MVPPWLGAVLGSALGAIIGSFLATVIIRWPRGESVSAGRSHCDDCGRQLGALELVPLISMIWLRGRCRACGATIDRRHVLVELAAAAIGGVAFGLFPDLGGLSWALLGWALLVLAILDAEHFWLPDAITLPLVALGLLLGGVATGVTISDRVIGLVAGFGSLRAVAASYRVIRHLDGLGGGDAKLFGAIGAWVGWQALPFVLLTSSVIALFAVGVAMLRGRAIAADSAFPFGTALCLGTLPAWVLVRLMTA